jgi:hypothetical protein
LNNANLDERVARLALKKAREKVRRCVKGEDSDSVCDVVLKLFQSFPARKEWMARGLARYMLGTVHPLSRPGRWVVDGVPALGDTHATYTVWLEGERYMCTCFMHPYGYVRKARICTHIAAVMFHRRQKRLEDVAGR